MIADVTPTLPGDSGPVLVCLPNAGAGTAAYRAWGRLLPGVDVLTPALPGRESRLGEPPRIDLDELEDLLAPLASRPWAVFGHSMGARLAFELVRRLQRRGVPGPRLFAAAASPAPHVASRQRPAAELTDDELLGRVTALGGTPSELLADPTARTRLVATLRADLELLDGLPSPAGAVLECPIVALAGVDDPAVSVGDVSAWRDCTRAPFTLHRLPGGHFAVHEHADVVALAVRGALGGAESPDAAPRVEAPGSPSGPDPVLTGPLSFAQAQLWYLEKLRPGEPTHNLTVALRLPAAADPEFVRRSLDAVVERHEALRTVVREEAGEPVAAVLPPRPVRLPETDLRGTPPADEAELAERLLRSTATAVFDLERGPLVRAHLIRRRTGPELVLVVHHLVADASSFGVLTADLDAAYRALAAGGRPALPELVHQPADVTAWQRERVARGELDDQLGFWLERLHDLPALDLVPDRPHGWHTGSAGLVRRLAREPRAAKALEDLAQGEAASLSMVFVAALSLVLHRRGGQDEVVLGLPVSGRSRPELDGLVGFLVNRVVLRVDCRGNPTLRELLRRVRDRAREAYANAEAPYDLVVERLAPPREPGRAPLVQVGCNLLPPETAGTVPGLVVAGRQVHNGHVRHDLNVDVRTEPGPAGDRLEALVEFRADLFDDVTADLLVDQLDRALLALASSPGSRLGEVDLLGEERRRVVLDRAAGPDRTGDRAGHDEATVPDRVRRQAAERPDDVAVDWDGGSLTYAELVRSSRALADSLARRDVGRGDVVALRASPGGDLVVGLLGVMTAGATWLPLDPRWPGERCSTVMRDADASFLLVDDDPAGGGAPPRRGTVAGLVADGDPSRPAPPVRPDDAAYLMYTSGSTGAPKGVVVEHGHLARYVDAVVRRLGMSAGEVSGLVLPVAFDASGTSLFPPLVTGGTLRLFPTTVVADPDALGRRFRERAVDHLKVTPSLLAALGSGAEPAAVAPRASLVLGGEAAPAPWLRELLAEADCTVVNHYGPTETTVGVLAGAVTADDLDGVASAPLGTPLGEARVYVLDRYLQPVPDGVPGELVIGGPTVARGYHGRPAETAGRFVPDPWSARPGARMYRTGDRGRRLPDGRLEFLGRLDRQVKVRGVRVEPAETERALQAAVGVAAAVVVPRPSPGSGSSLDAYVVPRTGERLDPGSLAEEVARHLPAVLVPATVQVLDRLPVTARGKLDVEALPRPGRADREAAGRPLDAKERVLAGVWQDVLGGVTPSPEDTFFRLGGDSIASIRVVARARAAGLELTPHDVLSHQTLRDQAAVARSSAPVTASGPVRGRLPLPPSHARVLSAAADPDRFWLGVRLVLRDDVDLEVLGRALTAVRAHHEALRARVDDEPGGGGWTLEVLPGSSDWPLLRLDAAAAGGPGPDDGDDEDVMAEQLAGRLRLRTGEVVAAGVATSGVGGGETRELVLVAHHLVVDVMSWGVLLDDLDLAYRRLAAGEPPRLPPVPVGLTAWLQGLDPGPAAEATAGTEDGLPTGAPEPVATDLEDGLATRRHWSELSADVGRSLSNGLGPRYGATLEDALVTALAAAAEAVGWPAVQVDLEAAGREPPWVEVDAQRTVGWLTRRYPVRLPTRRPGDLAGLLVDVKEAVRLAARDHGAATGAPAPDGGSGLGVNVLGDVSRLLDRAPRLSAAPPRLLARSRRGLPVDLDVIVSPDGGLGLSWTYDGREHAHADVVVLAEATGEGLAALAREVVATREVVYTPSDFPDAGLDPEGLALVVAEVTGGAPGPSAEDGPGGPAGGGGWRP
ncbi:MAG: amino acid adenylation domain-containing protein [Kineosporiaceae bacterium]